MSNVNPKVERLLEQMTLDEKILMVHGQKCDPYRANQAGFLPGCPRLGIPPIFIADGESGINTSWEATALPAKVSLAATFDTRTAREYGQILGTEAKESGMHVVLSPRVNIARDCIAPTGKSNGGNYQTYGEDPLLNGWMGAAEAEGIQKDNHAIANLKQMFGSSSGTAQGAGNCVMDEQTMHEIYMKPFEYAIRAGVGSNMTNYNQVNGIWTYRYTDMTQKMCRERWGFTGFTIDDWYCLYEPEAIKGGVTLEMPGEDYAGTGSVNSWYGQKLKDAILDADNPVTVEDLDQAVRYLLNTLDKFHMLDEARTPKPIAVAVRRKSAEFAHKAALRGAVLLKNENNVLPLDMQKESVAVIGPTARQQAMPIFKEAAYGFADRKKGPLFFLREATDKPVQYAVGDDLEGSLIPMDCIASRDGTPRSISLDIVSTHYDPLGDSFLPKPMRPVYSMGLKHSVRFTGEEALPEPSSFIASQNIAPVPDLCYMISGTLRAPETGFYRISLQSAIPSVEDFERHHVRSRDMQLSTSGNLYVKLCPDGDYQRIAIGTRVGMNGGAVPNSEVAPCMDGFNNAGGEVYMERGADYDFIATCASVYNRPVQARLCWTTPAMRAQNEREAVDIAAKADKALVFVWHHSPNETLTLHENQNELIEKIAEVNKNTIVVINSGDPIAMPWLPKVRGVLQMWFSGQEGGAATADILTGKYNPAGRLPITFPQKLEDCPAHAPGHPERQAMAGRGYRKDHIAENVAHFTEGILMGYRHYDANDIEPLFPFGYGLSYTTFVYEQVSATKLEDGGLSVRVTLRNSGARFGEEVVQCYLTPPDERPAGVQFAKRALACFARVALGAGERKTVEMTIEPKSFCYWRVLSEDNHLEEGEDWKMLAGDWTLFAGASSRCLPLSMIVSK